MVFWVIVEAIMLDDVGVVVGKYGDEALLVLGLFLCVVNPLLLELVSASLNGWC